jgi:hypothetical protein
MKRKQTIVNHKKTLNKPGVIKLNKNVSCQKYGFQNGHNIVNRIYVDGKHF